MGEVLDSWRAALVRVGVDDRLPGPIDQTVLVDALGREDELEEANAKLGAGVLRQTCRRWGPSDLDLYRTGGFVLCGRRRVGKRKLESVGDIVDCRVSVAITEASRNGTYSACRTRR